MQASTYDIEYLDDGNHEAGVTCAELRIDTRKDEIDALRRGIATVTAAGWPGVFLFMYDEAWRVLDRLWPVAEACLGSPCSLDPCLTAMVAAPKTSRVDMSGAPCRSHTYAESYREDGSLRLLRAVALLSPSSSRNGGLTVLPREFDHYYDSPEAWEHLSPCEEAEENVLSIKFGIQALRPIQFPAGSVVGLAGSLVHWPSRCSSHTQEEPAASISALFRGPEAGPCAFEGDALEREGLLGISVADRLAHISRALMLEAFDGKLSFAAFPQEFRDFAAP